MAAKSKFQISRTLDERIKRIIENVSEYEPEFNQVETAYILGFHSANVTNFVGLTTNFHLHHGGLQVVGQVYFKIQPTVEAIADSLKNVKEFNSGPFGFGSFKADQNEHLYLIYNGGGDGPINAEKRVFNSSTGTFLEDQPKFSILDDSKLFNHSALAEFKLSIRVNLLDSAKKLLPKEDIEKEIERVKLLFNNHNEIKINCGESSLPASEEATETLYDQLKAPNDVQQMGDYLPQMTKSDKEKLINKWRNKVKSERSPLAIQIEHEHLNLSGDEGTVSPNSYLLDMIVFHYLHVNDSISKSIKSILFSIRHRLDLLKNAVTSGQTLESKELRFCVFRPASCGHLVTGVYNIPNVDQPNYKRLAELRHELHMAYLLPFDKPQVRYNQRIVNTDLSNNDAQSGYLCNVHHQIKDNSGVKGGTRTIIEGTYTYHHYMQDRISDNGWGCAYRSLQTIISWFKHQGYIYSPDVELRASDKNEDKTAGLRKKLHLESRVPTHEEIQSVLVDVGDKQANFIGSQKWIGSQEVCYVLSHLYNLESKFISVSSGGELVYKARDLGQHFASQSTPIMIGGGVLAHTIIGVDFNEKNGDISYLILDPHYTGIEDLSTITKKGWCGWKKNSFWDKSAFYNLCLPQRPKEY